MIMEPSKRREYLDSEKDNLSEREYSLLDELFALRYKAKKSKNEEYVDQFLDLLIGIIIDINNSNTKKQYLKAGNNAYKSFSKLKIFEFREKDELSKEIIYNEFRQLLRRYISSCEEDRNFTKFFQLIPLTKNYYSGIIEGRITTMDELSKESGLDEKLPEFSRALKDEMEVYASKKEIKSYFER